MRNLLAYLRTREPTPRRPATLRPRAPIPFTPSPPAYPVHASADIVRPYVLHTTPKVRPLARPLTRPNRGLDLLLELSRPEAVAA
ncbi:hypothetical protein [Nocardiopsis sp. LOL_012]|uniref:hypothetical protein n=1 Tax=Nocardiopsis sp. LOL_012 TaxID=3345409 RepID=UPI003A8A64D3